MRLIYEVLKQGKDLYYFESILEKLEIYGFFEEFI
jgi:hypothetical protein